MKYFFIFLGSCGVLMLMAVAAALFIGVPIVPKEVTKLIEIKT
jgi:hypothetical protein